MPVQHESRRGKNRRTVDLPSTSTLQKERRWKKDLRSSVVDDDDELYDPDWEASEADLETYVDLSAQD